MAGEWTTEPLEGCIAALIDYRGKTPTKATFGVPLITAKVVKNGRIEAPDEFISEEDYEPWMRRGMPKAGDVLITTEAPLGEVAQLGNERVALAQRLIALRGKAGVLDNTFLKFLLQSNDLQAQLRARASGSTVSGIKQSELRRVSITLPPFSEQRAIAHILGTLDDKIELNRRRNQTLDAMARALFKDWFVDFGPVRAKMEGREPYLPADLWQLFPEGLDEEGRPEGWEMRSVGDCFRLTMGQSPPGNTYNDTSDGLPFFQGKTDFGFRYPENRKYCSAPTRIADAEDTLVSVRAPVGDINLAWEKCCVGRGVAAVRHLSRARSFTYHAVGSIQEELRQYEHTGTVFGAINKKQFEAIGFIDPRPELIESFENKASPMDDEVRKNIEESRTLAQLRDTLLPKLIAGELRIADAERFIESSQPQLYSPTRSVS